MRKFACIIGLLAATSLPVAAQECYTLSQVQDVLTQQNLSFVVIDQADIEEFLADAEATTGIDLPDGATNVILSDLGTGPVIGLEIDGCMTQPILLFKTKPAGVSI